MATKSKRERSIIFGPGCISIDEHTDKPAKTWRDHYRVTQASINRLSALIEGRKPEYIILTDRGPIVTFFIRGQLCQAT